MSRLFKSCPWKYFGWPALALVALLVAAGCDDDVGLTQDNWEKKDGGGSITGCGPGLEECSGKCINTKANNQNCGACGAACKSGEICTDGKCKLTCPPDYNICNGKCVSNKTDPNNCGACGKACKTGEVCADGKCAMNCPKDTTNCSG